MEDPRSPLKDKVVYVVGSLKNREKILPLTANLRKIGFKEVFEDWIAPGPEADDFWRDYERQRGRTYGEALKGWAGTHIFELDSFHIERSDLGVMCMPCGKSGHLEFGQILGSGKRGYVFSPEKSEELKEVGLASDGAFQDYESLKKELIDESWKPTERNNFSNIVMLYYLMRQRGHSYQEVRECVGERMRSLFENLSVEKQERQFSQYIATRELLGGEEKSDPYRSHWAKEVGLPKIMSLPCDEKRKKMNHLDFGFALGSGRRGYLLFDGEPERWDVMYPYADGIYFNENELQTELSLNRTKPTGRNNFSNIFMWFHSSRVEGRSIEEAKREVGQRLERMMQDYRGSEREVLKGKYESAMELLK